MSDLRHVMCIDDEPDIRLITQLALETLGGLQVTLCPLGAEAVAMARVAKPDLILLDVMMPGLDGPGTLKALREHPDTRRIPIIFMTAKVQPPELAHLRALGALDVIGKPFDPMTLFDTVLAMWKREP